MRFFVCILFLVLTTAWTRAQTPIAVPFTDQRWQFQPLVQDPSANEHVVEEYLGQTSLRLKNTNARLPAAQFTNGLVEYDMAFPADRGFLGLSFRVQDGANAEQFYIRPHQSGNPDATQYMPLFQGKEAWQLYQGEGYSAPVRFTFNQWTHVKVVVSGEQMEVFIGDMSKPALFVPDLKRPIQGGGLALNGNGHFANFSFTPQDKPRLLSTTKPQATTPAGTIRRWSVSSGFAEQRLAQVYQLTDAHKNGLTWQSLPVESTGLLNLATGPKIPPGANTLFAKVVLTSDKAQIKPLQLGFSDRVRVYLNDQLLYSGHDEFMSRDYRFFGTIGYYDTVYLPLKAGRNELWVAISENFGGWGIQGLLTNRRGLRTED